MFDEIDARRAGAGITQKKLCEAAQVHPTTYSAIKSGRSGGHTHTVRKLEDALKHLVATADRAAQ